MADTSTAPAPKVPSKDPKLVITPEARMNYAFIFRPQPGKDGQEAKFRAVFSFGPNADLTGIKRACQAAAHEKWGDKYRTMQLRNPIRRNEEMEGRDGFTPGGFFISASSNEKPRLVDQNVMDIMDQSVIFSGCYVYGSIRAFAYDNSGNKGVSFGLSSIQLIRPGARLDNRRTPEMDFQPLSGAGGGSPFGDDIGGAASENPPF